MRYLIKVLLTLLPLSLSLPQARGQELSAELRISTDAIGGLGVSAIGELERRLGEWLNTTRFTQQEYLPSERIKCRLSLRLVERQGDSYRGELTLWAARPVYGTSYESTLIAWRDREISFDYRSGDELIYTPQWVEHPLMAVLAMYAQLIIALDLDSFASLGGSTLWSSITTLHQSALSHADWIGWSAHNSSGRGRLINQLLDPSSETWRKAWYRYHRHGLDVLEHSLSTGGEELINALEAFATFGREYPNSPLVALLESSKASELHRLVEMPSFPRRDAAFDLLYKLFPSTLR